MKMDKIAKIGDVAGHLGDLAVPRAALPTVVESRRVDGWGPYGRLVGGVQRATFSDGVSADFAWYDSTVGAGGAPHGGLAHVAPCSDETSPRHVAAFRAFWLPRGAAGRPPG